MTIEPSTQQRAKFDKVYHIRIKFRNLFGKTRIKKTVLLNVSPLLPVAGPPLTSLKDVIKTTARVSMTAL